MAVSKRSLNDNVRDLIAISDQNAFPFLWKCHGKRRTEVGMARRRRRRGKMEIVTENDKSSPVFLVH